MNEIYYQEALEIADLLENNEMREYASKIRDNVESSSTGGKLIMKLNFTIGELITELEKNQLLYKKTKSFKKSLQKYL